MFIRKSDNNGKPYLSLVKKVKDSEGKQHMKYITGIGSVEKLEKAFKEPKKFFEKLLHKILENVEPEEDTDGRIPMKAECREIHLGEIYIRWILDLMGVKEFFENLQKDYDVSYDLYEMFCFLVCSQITNPSSFLKTVEDGSEFIEGTDIKLFDVYRALDIFAEHCQKLQESIYSHIEFPKEKTKMLYFDGTNIYFESEMGDENILDENDNVIESGFRTHGFSKENRPNPLVNIGMFDEPVEMPIDFELFPGREHEKTHVIPLLNNLRDNFGLKSFMFCADRGNYSGNVIAGIEAIDKRLGYDKEEYLLGLPIRQANTSLKNFALDPKGFQYYLISTKKGIGYVKYKIRKVEKSYNYKNDEGKSQGFKSEQLQFIYFSNSYAKREKHKRSKKIKKAEKLVERPGDYNAATNSGAAAFVKEEHYVKKTGEIAKGQNLSINEEKIKRQAALDGYYVIVSNDTSLMPMRIKFLYHKLTYLEDNFKYLKSFLKVRPVYVRKPKHILAHVLICIISLQVLQIMRKLLNDSYTIKEIIDGLSDYRCIQVYQDRYMIFYSTPLIEELKKLSGKGFEKRRVSFREIKTEIFRPGIYVTLKI